MNVVRLGSLTFGILTYNSTLINYVYLLIREKNELFELLHFNQKVKLELEETFRKPFLISFHFSIFQKHQQQHVIINLNRNKDYETFKQSLKLYSAQDNHWQHFPF